MDRIPSTIIRLFAIGRIVAHSVALGATAIILGGFAVTILWI